MKPPAPLALPELGARLRRQARKLTGPRQAILAVLHRQSHPMSNKQIHAALGRGECDLATVYRAMWLLENLGLVLRSDFGDGVARYELRRDGETHHHHLVCTHCAAVVEVEGCCAGEWEQLVAARNGYKAVTHRLGFFGVCPACQ